MSKPTLRARIDALEAQNRVQKQMIDYLMKNHVHVKPVDIDQLHSATRLISEKMNEIRRIVDEVRNPFDVYVNQDWDEE